VMDRSVAQLRLFGSLEGFPEGFSYEEEILTWEEERALVQAVAGLPLKAFEFQGFQGNAGWVSTDASVSAWAPHLRVKDAVSELSRSDWRSG
jgi:hypothetical protein